MRAGQQEQFLARLLRPLLTYMRSRLAPAYQTMEGIIVKNGFYSDEIFLGRRNNLLRTFRAQPKRYWFILYSVPHAVFPIDSKYISLTNLLPTRGNT